MSSYEKRLLAGVLQACNDATDAIVTIYESDDFEVQAKQDKSPLTEADMASHHILVAALKALTPDIPILSEESADMGYGERRRWDRLWVVDPLDGTREFIKRNGEFTINVALVVDHVPMLGIIAVPVSRIAYTGIVGEGAQRWRNYREPEPIQTRRPCAQPPVVLGSRSHADPRTRAYFEMLGEHEQASCGSALKFCAVAEGAADFYPRLGPTSEWDTAAGEAIVTAAGGKVWMPDGKPLLYNLRETTLNGDFLVAGDPEAEWPVPPPAG